MRFSGRFILNVRSQAGNLFAVRPLLADSVSSTTTIEFALPMALRTLHRWSVRARSSAGLKSAAISGVRTSRPSPDAFRSRSSGSTLKTKGAPRPGSEVQSLRRAARGSNLGVGAVNLAAPSRIPQALISSPSALAVGTRQFLPRV